MMLGESSSEESEEKSSNDSDYEASESSDGNGDDDVGSFESRTIITRRRAKSVMISIPEAIKMRRRRSGISIREPTESPILLGPWLNHRPRDTARCPAQRFKNLIVASSLAANIVPDAVSTQAQVNNVNGGSITTSSIPQVNGNTGNITTSFESGLNPWSSSLQDFVLGSSSSGSNIERAWSVSASGPIPSNTIIVPLGSSSSNVQSPANITTEMASSSSSMPPLMLQHMRCLDLNQPANEDDDEKIVEEEDEGLDLNKPANEDYGDEKKDEGLDLNKPANEEDDEIMVEKENEGLDLNKVANEDEKKDEEEDKGLDLNKPANEDDDEIMVEKENEGLDLNKPANEDEEEYKGWDLNQPAPDE